MFSHFAIGSNDLEASRRFYDATIGALGGPKSMKDKMGRLIYNHAGGLLIVTMPVNGEPATFANGSTMGFAAPSPEHAEAWHAAGVAAGGSTCEDPPGWRERPFGRLYLAYLRDPDGNKLCAMYREQA